MSAGGGQQLVSGWQRATSIQHWKKKLAAMTDRLAKK